MNKTLSPEKTWKNFYETTAGLKKPGSVSALIGAEDQLALITIVKTVLIQFLRKGELNQGLKIFIDGELSNHFASKMQARPAQEEESLEDWCSVIFGDRKFGLVFNSMEAFSNEIAEKMCGLVHPLLEQAGIPLGGLSFLFFMGNYGFTPFGIHKEAVGEEGFLFHLGPGKKKFYTWDFPEYNRIPHNSKIFRDIKGMLPDAKEYSLSPGSAMFIPHQVYHIANTEVFSLSVVMDFINPSTATLQEELAADISHDANYDEPATYSSPQPLSGPLTETESLLNPPLLKLRFAAALERRIARLRSNGGILHPSLLNKSLLLPNGSFYISGKSGFPLIVQENLTTRPLIFARGHQFSVVPHTFIATLLSQINAGAKLSLIDLRAELEPQWTLSNIFSLVQDLLSAEAIEVHAIPET